LPKPSVSLAEHHRIRLLRDELDDQDVGNLLVLAWAYTAHPAFELTQILLFIIDAGDINLEHAAAIPLSP
jgi:hypothetical protein